MTNRRFAVLVACLQFAVISVVTAGTASAEVSKRAVLIGVDDYLDDDKISDLQGCGNDVDLMKSVLVGKFDFAPDDVRVLKDKEATRSGIINTIRSHLGQSQQGDIALVHYSGHGSQMEDASGDEADGKDETIVPHDSRTKVGDKEIFDISDDEINGMMKEISDKTPNVVFILDSCHSGTAARAAGLGNTARKAPADDRPPPEPEPWAMGARGLEEAADGIRLPGANYVLISGCRANELSNETVFDGARHGAMTFFLARALKAARAQTTYRDLMEQVKADVNTRFAQQHPQLEGTGMDTKVFGSERVLAQPYVLVEPEGNGAVVYAGKVFGVESGTVFAVYPPGTKVFDGSEPSTGKVRVTGVKDFTSTASVVEGDVAPHSRTVLGSIMPPAYRAGLFLHDVESSELLQAVAQKLADQTTIEIVTDPGEAEIRAAATGTGGDAKIVLTGREGQELSVADSSTGPKMELNCQGQPVDVAMRFEAGTPAATRVLEKAVAQIKHWARWYGLLAIDNPGGGDLPMDFRIERLGATEADAAPEVIAPGDQVRIAVSNSSTQQKVHLTLLDFWSNGRVCVLHPTATPEPLEPGEVWEKQFRAGLPTGESTSVDIVKAFFTTDPLPTSVFNLDAAPRAGLLTPETPLERYLQQYSRGQRALFSAVPASGWTTQARVLRIESPGVENRGFVAHYETAEAAEKAPQGLTRSGEDDRTQTRFAGDATMVAISTNATRGDDASVQSVGQAFQGAYEFRERACQKDPEACPLRVEPLLELELERSQSAPLPEDELTRGIGGKEALPVAKNDAVWSHKYTRVPEAWEHLRSLGKPAGAEARGVVVAHPDTGYLEHEEIWLPASDRPILADKGWDYLEGDDEPLDRTEKKRLLDNPVHGTGSSSAMISREGCQITGFERCPTGVAQGAHLVPLRVNSSVINFSGKRLAQALLDASGSDRTRVKVSTDLAAIAMGGPPSWALWKAVQKAEERGFIVIAAAGNYVRTVVWPARYDSVIAVAAVNAECDPWTHSSRGGAVDIAAPGESVWRATIDKQETRITGMGTGTTYGTATTGGIAALWVAKHKGTPAYEALREHGLLTRALRHLMQETSWQPGGSRVPADAQCKDGVGWNSGKFGAGILDARALLEAELPAPDALRAATRSLGAADTAVDSIEELPLWNSLYAQGTPPGRQAADYRRLFAENDADLEDIAIYEAEILHHYAANESFSEAIDEIVLKGRQDEAAFKLARQRLKAQDLSTYLRRALQ